MAACPWQATTHNPLVPPPDQITTLARQAKHDTAKRQNQAALKRFLVERPRPPETSRRLLGRHATNLLKGAKQIKHWAQNKPLPLLLRKGRQKNPPPHKKSLWPQWQAPLGRLTPAQCPAENVARAAPAAAHSV